VSTPPCPNCPVRGLPCIGLTDPHYCSLMARAPARYASVVLRRTREHSGLAWDVGPPPGRAITAAILAGDLTQHGHEAWIADLVRATDPDCLNWSGVALGPGGRAGPGPTLPLAELVPLHGGPTARVDGACSAWIAHHPTDQEAIEEACHGAEVLVVAGLPLEGMATTRLGLPVVYVASHDADLKAARCALEADIATWVVTFSQGAVTAFPPSLQARVLCLPRGVELGRCTPRWGRDRVRAAWGLEPAHRLVGLDGPLQPRSASLLNVALATLGPAYQVVSCDGVPCVQGPAEGGTAGSRWNRHDGDILAALDVYVVIDPAEAIPPGLMSAWLASVPVVATSTNELRALEREWGGLTVAVQSTATSLAEGIRRALGPEGVAASERAGRLAWEQYHSRAMAARWAEFLATVARPRPARGVAAEP